MHLEPIPYLLVNFGGPRNLKEIEPFLIELLCDRDVIRTRFPKWFHNWLFTRVAKKRAIKGTEDYEKIGGCSPIYQDTETLRSDLEKELQAPIFTFHRYLPATHRESLLALERCPSEEIRVLPLFPQFSYATTGSIARFFQEKLSCANKLRWIKSYSNHPAFISTWVNQIGRFLEEKKLKESEIALFFSAHGLPRSFIEQGDPYQTECEASFRAIMQAFPRAVGRLAYQSKFGRGEWLRPYTDEECDAVLSWNQEKKEIVFIPLSFTSDHIETLFEVEELYLPKIRSQGVVAHRCPAIHIEPNWARSLSQIAKQTQFYRNSDLIRV